jgi:hypothetical protein
MDATAAVRTAEGIARALGAIGGALVVVVIAWQFLKVMLTGSDRALIQAGKTLLVIGLAAAVVTHPGDVAALALQAGNALLAMISAVVRDAVAAS